MNGQSGDLTLTNNGFTSIEIDSATTTAAGADTLTIAAGQTITLDSVVDGDLTDDGNNKGEIEITGATAVTSASLVLDGVGASTLTSANDDLDIDVTSASITSLSIKSQGTVSTDKNYVGIQNTGAKLETLTITGDKLLDAREDAVTTLKTINASASTGGVVVNVTGSTLDVSFTGGTGADTLIVGADLDTNDVIDGGDGTDTVSISDATLTSSTLAAVKGANAAKNVEVLGVSAATTITIDASLFTNINTFTNTAAVSGTEAASGPSDGVNFTFQNGDSFTVSAGINGGDGSASAGAAAGADALEVAAKVNSGTDTITITIAAGAAVTLKGGSGSDAGSAADNGTGGHAINAASVETINIVTASSKDDLTLTGGTAGSGAGDNGSTLSVGANATINISGAGDVDLGLIATQGTAVDDLTVDGSAMTGILTVAVGAGNDIVKGGSGADVLTLGTTAGTAAGINTATGNGGADTFKLAIGTSTTTAITSITDFEMGAGKDVIDVTGKTAVFEKLTSANADLIAVDTTLADAVAQAFTQLAANEATAFVWNGNAYVVFEDGTGAGTYTAAQDLIVKLTGVTSVAAFDSTNIA